MKGARLATVTPVGDFAVLVGPQAERTVAVIRELDSFDVLVEPMGARRWMDSSMMETAKP